MNFGINSITDLLLKVGPYEPNEIVGAVKGYATGNFDLVDPQRVEFTVNVLNGITVKARPVYGFGARAYVPTAQWLAKYKNQVFFWLMFEEGYMNKAIYLGWAFNEGQATDNPDLQDYPDSAMWRTVNWFEQIDDDVPAWRIVHRQSGNMWELTDQHVLLTTPSILLGAVAASNPAVLGNNLNANLKQILQNLSTLFTNLGTQMQTTATAAAANPNTAALAPGLITMSNTLTTAASTISGLIANLPNHLSQKTMLDI